MKPFILILCIHLLHICTVVRAEALSEVSKKLASYRAELDACRAAHGGTREMPDVKFFLFGMGARTKCIYKSGILLNAVTGRELRRWNVRAEVILPPAYEVRIETNDGKTIAIREDESALWIEEDGQRAAVEGTASVLKLPDFVGKRYPQVLRVLHQELLVNITSAGPLPNFFVYAKPWYRDGAMMAVAFKATGNVALLKPWIDSVREPFDKNNAGITEPDNLGQILFIASLVSDKTHPVVARVLAELQRFETSDATGKFITGKSDFNEHPVYQTKWLKYGLRALDLPDTYVIPTQKDSYSALFWMDYAEAHVPGGDAQDRGNYPYLGWACDHFHKASKSPLSNRDYPLTWEAKASQAKYEGMKIIDPVYVEKKLCVPHTWHAAEAFLLLMTEDALAKKAE